MAENSDVSFRKRDMVRQLRAFGARRLLFRIVERVDRGSVTLPSAIMQGRFAELDLADLADRAFQKDLRVAPGEPSGLVTLTGVTREGVERISALGLEPCCVVRGPSGHVDAWVQLARTESELAALATVPVRLLLTVAAQRLTALAGGDPRTAHYAQGGYLAGVYQEWSQGAVAVLVAEDRMASAREGLLSECVTRALSIEQAAETAAAAGVDSEREVEALVSTGDLGIPLETLYRRQAAVARAWGVTDPEALDRSVAAAAARLGAPPTRVRALLNAASPLRGTSGFAVHVRRVVDAVYADATTIYAASKIRLRAERAAGLGEVWADAAAVDAATGPAIRRSGRDGDRSTDTTAASPPTRPGETPDLPD